MAENIILDERFVGDEARPAIYLAADATLDGVQALGSVDVEGLAVSAAVVVYSVDDVSSLDPAIVGAEVIAALGAL